MPKRVELQDKGKIRGIRRRWLLNSIGVLALIMVLLWATFAVSLWTYYSYTITADLSARAELAANTFKSYTRSEYQIAAQNYISNFEDRSKLEVQFIDTTGAVLFSGYGLTAGTTPGTPDITDALEQRTPQVWPGRDPATKEPIMAASAPVIYQGTIVGVIRFVTSMSEVNRQFILGVTVVTLIMALFMSMMYFSNLYFVRSLVEPLTSIVHTTRLIAGGSYGTQIEKKYDDEIGELIDAINDMSLKVKQSETTQSEFISSVSHELRTPLTAINGWAETIQSGEIRTPNEFHKGMEIIISEARRLTNMVEELLEFSRMQDGRFTLSVERLDLKSELEDAVYTYQEFFRKEGITLEYQECKDEMVLISGDPERLRQVFCNLLDNAAKHGGSGKRIDVSLDRDSTDAVLRIRDYGPGIPPEELPQVKMKFYKGSSKARGSGIGLAVCEEIVQRHEGILDVDNAPGGGCLVTVRLPIDE
ncbi:MAG: HAMP domain-containing histidine kinase [Oscillospiraceae bacterium]|jgi:two-component system OmpR family sensor kinase|nr:HAMP domain-containing histidine kinase [Oscillospiraceae bacterium]MCI9393222.1 HAMP domain-containing histidine kinase [Oscillospiraceae bacterium]MCI9580038.1 HAMP domain-containing histidine kinase [Oscillospiraceae bacterium]